MQCLHIEEGNFGGYAIVNHWKSKDNRKGKTLIASGFSRLQKAIDYARLYAFNTDLKSDYKFTDYEKSILQDIDCEVCNQYCSWQGFVENVIEDSQGLSGLLQKINEKLPVNKIVNCYI